MSEMLRIPEPEELMLDAGQAHAYGTADLSRFNGGLIEGFRQRFPGFQGGRILDLGCGTGDIAIRLAQAYPEAQVVGIDGSPAMLEFGCAQVASRGLESRVELRQGYLPDAALAEEKFDAVVANIFSVGAMAMCLSTMVCSSLASMPSGLLGA